MTDSPSLLGLDDIGPFRANKARYNHGLDALTYRAESGLCVADRVDPFLTLLWSEDGERPVGVRLKGLRYVYNRLRDKYKWVDIKFLPLVSLLEAVMEAGLGDQLLQAAEASVPAETPAEEAGAEKRRKGYALAHDCVEGIHLTEDQIEELVEV